MNLGHGGKEDDTLVTFFRALEERGVKQNPLRNALPLKWDETPAIRLTLNRVWSNPYQLGVKESLNLDTHLESVCHQLIRVTGKTSAESCQREAVIGE